MALLCSPDPRGQVAVADVSTHRLGSSSRGRVSLIPLQRSTAKVAWGVASAHRVLTGRVMEMTGPRRPHGGPALGHHTPVTREPPLKLARVGAPIHIRN